MAPDVSGGLRNSSSAKNRHMLKKGPWTTAEDLLLLEYVKKHGEGNWNAVQRNSGLMRCGKSCRLRWANHLRPNLKKGAFSPEEEHLIVELHSKLGNKWARMAAQIPGRTDNEIKNYWNTRLKRRQRAGLPIYPHEEQHHHHRRRNSSQTPLLSSLLAKNPNPFTFAPSAIAPPENQLKFYRGGGDGGGLTLSLEAASSSLFSSSAFFNTGGGNQLPMNPLLHYNCVNYGVGATGLPSIQSPPLAAAIVTPAGSSSEFVVATTSSDGGEDFEVERRSKSGLLEDLFGESQALAYHGREEKFVEEGGDFHESYEGTGTGAKAAPEEGMAPMDDELMNLLDNFPLSVPIPDWNGDGSESPVAINGTSNGMRSQSVAPEYNVAAASSGAGNQDWNFGSCLWNNMPSIY